MANLTNVANITTKVSLALVSVVTAACTSFQAASDSIAQKPTAEPTSMVVLRSEVKWDHLNPARGDKSPQAGTLWGDRKGTVPTGFLVKFVDGFSVSTSYSQYHLPGSGH